MGLPLVLSDTTLFGSRGFGKRRGARAASCQPYSYNPAETVGGVTETTTYTYDSLGDLISATVSLNFSGWVTFSRHHGNVFTFVRKMRCEQRNCLTALGEGANFLARFVRADKVISVRRALE
jgi:YD repeat-containing protein